MYQRVYGPLTITYPCNKWDGLKKPWPWEGGEKTNMWTYNKMLQYPINIKCTDPRLC